MGKGVGYLLGIFGMAALCMLPSSLGATIFYDGFESGNLNNWTVDKSGVGVVDAYYLTYYHGHYGMRLYSSSSSDSDANAYTDISDLDTDSYYEVEIYVVSGSSSMHWMYVVYDGQICCVLDTNNYLTLRYGSPPTNHGIMSLLVDHWYRLNFYVYPSSGYYYLYVNSTYTATGNFFTSPASYLLIGDDEGAHANYGYMVVDDVGVYQ